MPIPNSPIRCFEGSAQPYEPFWVWNVAEGQDPELDFNGYISEYSWWGDEITPAKFKADLEKHGQGGPVTIRMHSYGGDLIAANMIATIIRDYPGFVTVQIDTVAASAATMVAIAGDLVKIQETAYFMIHDPLFVVFLAALNIEDLNRLASSLQTIKEGIVNGYETKTGLSRARLAKMMTDETWMDANRALDLGFVDEVLRPGAPIPIEMPQNMAAINALQNFKNVPQDLLRSLQGAPIANESTLTDDEKREAQSLRDRINPILKGGKSNA